MTAKRLYLGAQNDELYIVDAKPSASDDDVVYGDNPDVHFIARFYDNSRSGQELAQRVVDAYNEVYVDGGRHRPQTSASCCRREGED
jgi:hypothetical protein